MTTFGEVVARADLLMGVKAVFGRLREPIICFGARGDGERKTDGYFAAAKAAAGRAINQPYLVTIGGGDEVRDGLKGHVVELLRVAPIYGETEALVQGPEMRARLARWPVATVVTEVYSVVDEPDLLGDLGFADRAILANAFDTVLRKDLLVDRLWEALSERKVARRWEIPVLPELRDSGRLIQVSRHYPRISAIEGEALLKQQRVRERDPRLASLVKAANRAAHGGILVCEGCSFSDADSAMFESHHLHPLFVGSRESRADDFAVLCPTCHRLSHVKAKSRVHPLFPAELRRQRSTPDVTTDGR